MLALCLDIVEPLQQAFIFAIVKLKEISLILLRHIFVSPRNQFQLHVELNCFKINVGLG